MALSTTQYGYIIDPMVPFTDDKGKTIKNGFVRVFVAGSSTPVITYRNFDGAANQDLIELDNSGRTKTSVIGSKGLTYKVRVYDKHHSQESPILTVDKVSVIGANITAGTGATVVTGLDGLTTKPDGFVDASVVGTDGYVSLDHTLVTDDLNTDAKVTAVENDRYIPLLNEDVNDPDSKMTLGRLWQWVLGKIKSLPTTITAFRTGDVIPVDGPQGTAKMSKDDLLRETSDNALAGNIAPAFDATKPNGDDGFAYHIDDRVYYSEKWYRFILDKPSGAWDSSYVAVDSVDYNLSQIENFKANKFDDKVFDFGDWELGSFNAKTLVDDDTDNTVIRTALIPITKTTRFTVNVPTDYDMFMGCSTTEAQVYWFDGQQQITIPANNYVRFAIKKSVRPPLTYDTPNNIFAESGIYCEGDKIYDVSDVKNYADTINESVYKTESFIRLPESLTVSSSPVNSRYAIMINNEKGVFIKTITPRWAKSEGSFNWRFVYGILNEVGTKVILGEEHSATIGDSIFVNSYINKYIGLLLYSSTSGMLYVDNTGDPTKNHPSKLGLFSVGGSPNKVTNFLDNYAPYCAFLTRETADEPFENINKLSGKFIAAIGDSMVYGDTLGASKTWLFKISQRNGMPSLNLGKNATFLSNRQQGGKNNSVYHRICDSTSPFYVSDDVLKRCDYFIVYSGTNDCDKNVTIGNVDSSNTQEFCGALNAICDTLQTRSPKTRFAFITPYIRSGIEAKCVNYINAIKNVCSKYGIPVFDNGALGGINWNNASIVSTLTMNDTFHLNEAGMEWVSYKYESFIKSL